MAVKPTELLLMPEELKRKSGTNDSKSISSEIKSLDSPNKSPSNSPRTANVWRKASFESPLLPNQEKRQSHSSNGIFFQGNFFWKELEKSAGGVQTLLVVGGTVWCGCIDGTLSIYEVRSGQKLGIRRAHNGRIFAMSLVGDVVWTASDDNHIKIWNYRVALLKDIDCNLRLLSMMQSSDKIWCGTADGVIQIFDAKTYQLKKELLVEKKSNAIRYMYRHKYTVWACTEDHIIRINLKSYEIIGKVDGAKINSIVYVNQNDLWGGSSDSTIRIWDAESGQVKKVIQAHDGNILVLFSYGGLVWSGGGDKTIRIWNAKTFELVAEVSEKHETISSVILVPYKILIKRDNNSSSTTIATSSATEFTELYTVWIGSWDGRITVWL